MGKIWQAVTTAQEQPAMGVILAIALLAAWCVCWPPAWRQTRQVVTIVHEGAHGAVAAAVGRRLSGIRLHSDTSGLTVSRGRPTGPGMRATLAAGYVGPGLFGLGAAAVLHTGHAVALLWGFLTLLTLLLLQIRNWFGLWSVLASGAVVFAVSWWAPGPAQSAFAYLLTWFLLLAAPRAVLEIGRDHRRGGDHASDAGQLARLTRIPAVLWVGFFLLVTMVTLVLGGGLILLP